MLMDNKEDKPCTLTLCHGTHFDLNGLSSATADYATTVGSSTYKLNVCRSVVSEVWKIDRPEEVGGFVNGTNGDFSIGRVNTTLHISPSTDEPMLYLNNGSPCPLNPEERASSVIRFVCTPSEFSAGKPELIAAIPPLDTGNSCHFFFEWKTHVACPTNRKAEIEAGHYIAFGSILFIAILTWFAGHTLYNRFYLDRRGLSQFPLPQSFPKIKIPSFKKSGSSGSSRPKWGFGRRSQRSGGYTAMNTDESQGFAARYSLSDDDDEHEDLTGGGEDARVLGGEAREWRGEAGRDDRAEASVGVHQGLVDV